MMEQKWLIYFLLILSTSQAQKTSMSCSYGGRGSLTSICSNANAAYFRKTSYRFDNLDETVRCVNCDLQVIESFTFDLSGNQIHHLDLSNSHITLLKSKSFIGLIFLKTLNLESNYIAVIPPEAFQGVTRIEKINLRNNVITSLVANAMTGLTDLKTLDLSNNKIENIETDAFNNLVSLRVLDLSKNQIIHIHNIFTESTKIIFLNLQGNRIGRVEANDFKYLSNLLLLTLNKNNMKFIEKNTFLPLHNLQSLNLSSNLIEAIQSDGFRGLSSLEELDLSDCLIGNVQKGLLFTLHKLRTLNLSFNKLGVFQTGTFSGLPELRVLNMTHNKIRTFEKTGVFKLTRLHNLDLSYNELKTFNYKFLVKHLPALAYLGLENNHLGCFLKNEMEELFKSDNFKFNLGMVDDSNGKCNESKIVDEDERPAEGINVTTEAMKIFYHSSSGQHEYFLYVFIVFTTAIISVLFYLQRRDRHELDGLSQTDSYEARLIVN